MMKLSLEEGEGQFGFAKRIRQEWPLVATRKAEQIAVTEWNRAASHATFKGYVRQRETHKVWFTAGDNRVCPICEANSADGEIGIEKSFASGDLYPPAHPDCRCNISSAVV
jgi:SPP1 gp7 family putative phage head morphogenesis protein